MFQTAKDDGAYKLYKESFVLGNKLIDSLAEVSEPRSWSKVKAFVEEMDSFVNKPRTSKRKAVRRSLVSIDLYTN